jgi:hypothetical protein
MSNRKNLLALLTTILLFLSFNNQSAFGQCSDLYIAGVIDGPLTGGTPKGVLFCANANIADLSIYGFGSANNGDGTDGIEFIFPAQSINSGDCFWVASETSSFNMWFGFDPCFTSNVASVSGDDAIELFCNGTLIDILGEVDCDPNDASSTGCLTTPSWEYTDGWVAANDMVPSSTYDPANWTISGINVLDGESTNATASAGFPITTQSCPSAGCSITNVILMADGTCTGDNASYEVCADVAGGSGDYDLVDIDNGNAILSSLTSQSDGQICFTVSITGPTSASNLNVDVVDNADATCISGSPVAVTVPTCPITVCTISNVAVMSDGVCNGDDATYTVCADVAAGSGNYDLVDTDNGNAVLASLTTQPDGPICFTVTISGPTTASSLNVDVVDASDPTCIGGSPVAVAIPACPVMMATCPGAFISEFAYDCDEAGDPNEGIEVCVPNSFTGLLSDITVELYNGDNNMVYGTLALDQDFTVGADDGTNTYYSYIGGSNSIQQGPEGIALVFQGTTCEFLSYEGVLTADGGSADGMMSTDIGISQTRATTCDMSLMFCDGMWQAGESTFGFGCDQVVDPGCNAAITTFPANGN